jgi:heptosyltransferase-1
MALMLKLLIVKTSSLGDVVHNLPIIHDILSHHPDAKIDWVVEENFADIPRLHPGVNQVIPVAIRRWRKSIFSKQTWHEINIAKQRIAQFSYDIILDTQGLLKSGLITSAARGQSHGYDKHSAREPLASFFYQHTHPVARNQHAVARNRSLAALALDYVAPDNLPDYGIHGGTIHTHISHTHISDTPYVMGLHGTSRDSKLWPTEHWIDLAFALNQRKLKLVLPWASAAELTRAQTIAAAAPNVIVLPKQSIAELAAIISQSKAAVGVDTGLSHLSVALNIPTLAIYTDTDPALTGIYAGSKAPAINLGNINQTPTVQQVIQNLEKII